MEGEDVKKKGKLDWVEEKVCLLCLFEINPRVEKKMRKKVNSRCVVENVLMEYGGAFVRNVRNKKYNKYKESTLCKGMLPSSVLNGRCPYELVYNKKPSLSHLRDVKLNETVFPFIMKTSYSKSLDYVSESDHLSFFDNNRSQSPNNKGRTSSVEDGSSPLPRHRSIDTTNLYQEETPRIRRSSRQTKMPVRFNDFVVNSNSVEPSSYVDALNDNNWVEAMNNEIEALKTNNMYEHVAMDLTRLGLTTATVEKTCMFKISQVTYRKACLMLALEGFPSSL
ncbi:hypothetical protein Tco_0052773 [Tanacetum coccineum]